MKRTITAALTIILFWGLNGFAQTYDYSSEPGYVDFGNLEMFENSDESTEVFINQNLLHMVAKMGKHMDINGKKDSSFAEMVGGLKLIKVNNFGIDSTKIKSLFKLINKIDKELINKGWDRLVKQKEKNGRTNVYIRTDNNSLIQGLVVTQADKDEATFINIVGIIDLEKLGELSSNFDIPDMGNIMNGKSKKGKKEIEINVNVNTDSTNTK